MTYIVLVYCFFYYGMFDKLYGETEAIVEAHKRPNLYEKKKNFNFRIKISFAAAVAAVAIAPPHVSL